MGTKMPKHYKLGIHRLIEEKCLAILSLTIDASLRSKQEKIPYLMTSRREIEILKHLIRMEYEIGIINEKSYILIASLLQNISMMATGWQKSLQTQKPLM